MTYSYNYGIMRCNVQMLTLIATFKEILKNENT